jgi:hypothetical protein
MAHSDVSLTEPVGNWATFHSMWPYAGTGRSASAELYFSHTCGIKMDTSILETESKQGAATSADLLQQDQKSSTASSDKERLAAGIFMTGLQASL